MPFPNPDTQFQPGQSGNPTGPKPGYKHITTHIQELLEDENFEADLLDSKKGLVSYKGRPIKAIIMVLQHKAVQGDLKAADLLLKYGWSAKTEVDLTSNGEQVGITDPAIAAGFADYLKHKK